ncbi:MAG: M20/M25/M40 family metallo-hydrolase [Acidimicrobiia bacterium]|nr:M20/M25/M40 family metallo-hydrolase [Acidimicrobiia bacterium]
MSTEINKILDRIEASKEDMAELMLRLGNTYGPFGQEAATAAEVHDWYGANGMQSDYVEIIEGRACTVGRIAGDGTGKSLIYNAHLDTEASGKDFDTLMDAPDPNIVGARREGDHIFGHTVQNDRGCMAMQMIAGRAIVESGVQLKGDLLLKSAAGETGATPVDEFKGLRYEGKGFGTSYLVEHGYRADYAVIAETTDFAASWIQCGAAYYKITLRGRNMYTPRLLRGETLAEQPNAIVRAASVVELIEKWAVEFEAARTRQTECGMMRPKAQVGAIRGGIPWRPNRSSTYAALYVDVRTLPGESVESVTKSISAAVRATGLEVEVELIMAKAGFEAPRESIAPLLDEITVAHRHVRGVEMPDYAEDAVVGMWRDTNVYNRVGIPSLTFGPSRGKAAEQGTGFIDVNDFVDGAKIYALTALSICGDLRP